MKAMTLAATATLLLAAPVLAQDSRPSPRTGPIAPDYTQGSGQSAGGPARELNSPTGGPLSTQGTVFERNPNIPTYQSGSGQRAGGPASELNSPTGAPRR